MNVYLLAAGVLAILIGVIHSLLGEKLIFSKLRKTNHLIPTEGAPLLLERNVRIIWATWHIVSIFGWALGGLLIWGALYQPLPNALLIIIGLSMLLSSLFVLIATKGKHPGWFGLLLVGVLIFLNSFLHLS